MKAMLKAIILELRNVLRDNGQASWARYGSLIVILTWCAVALHNKAIPERTEMVAILVGALYGVNTLPKIMDAIYQVKEAKEKLEGGQKP
jgi:hypothetical protein